jgi:ABC-type uncharacterized transport system involved in gliding motility auxiliary subunit
MTWKKFARLCATIIIGLAVLVGLNILAKKADLQYDTTKNKRYSLSKQTVKVLKQLRQPVKALCFYRPGEGGRKNLEDLLKLYAKESDKFDFEFVDPDRSPFRAREYKVRQTGEVILLSENKQEKILFPDEEKLTNALIRVSNPEKAKFYFVQGHGEVAFSALSKSPSPVSTIDAPMVQMPNAKTSHWGKGSWSIRTRSLGFTPSDTSQLAVCWANR